MKPLKAENGAVWRVSIYENTYTFFTSLYSVHEVFCCKCVYVFFADTDYVFAHFCGILATSTLYFVLYSICKRNKPVVCFSGLVCSESILRVFPIGMVHLHWLFDFTLRVVIWLKLQIYPSVVLPAMVSGGMWAVAEVGWFIANHYLSEAISFPIITTGPGIVASLWGVCVFREVKVSWTHEVNSNL